MDGGDKVGGWPRIGALAVDLTAWLVLALVMLVAGVHLGFGVTEPVTDIDVLAATIAASGVLQATPWLALAVLVVGTAAHGASPGQRLLGLEVVRAHDTGRPERWRLLLRTLLGLLGLAAFGLTFWWMLLDRRGRALHERLSGTWTRFEDESRIDLAKLGRPT